MRNVFKSGSIKNLISIDVTILFLYIIASNRIGEKGVSAGLLNV